MIKVLVTGDFCPINRIEQIGRGGNLKSVYNNFSMVLKNNDLNITNLECPFYNGKVNSIIKTGPSLKADDSMAKILTYGNFNLVTLANNHLMDFGVEGLKSTIEACQQENISFVGAGYNVVEARRIFYTTIRGIVIAILNVTENEWSTTTGNYPGSNPLNPVANYYDIKEARKNADRVILIIHGGHEKYSLPSPRMVETYRFFIDAGADIVIGHHPHCFSGHEKYKEGHIFYSVGNFIFDWKNYRGMDWNYGYAIKLYFDENSISFDIIPYNQCDNKPGVFLLNDSEKEKFNEKLTTLNNTISNDRLLNQEWEKLVLQKKKYYLMNFEPFNSRIFKSLRYRSLLPGLLMKKKRLLLLDMIRCEAHRDLAIESLKQSI